MSRQKAMNLKVARVLDDNTLLIEGALSQEVSSVPGRLEVWRMVDVRQRDVIRRLDDYARAGRGDGAVRFGFHYIPYVPGTGQHLSIRGSRFELEYLEIPLATGAALLRHFAGQHP